MDQYSCRTCLCRHDSPRAELQATGLLPTEEELPQKTLLTATSPQELDSCKVAATRVWHLHAQATKNESKSRLVVPVWQRMRSEMAVEQNP